MCDYHLVCSVARATRKHIRDGDQTTLQRYGSIQDDRLCLIVKDREQLNVRTGPSARPLTPRREPAHPEAPKQRVEHGCIGGELRDPPIQLMSECDPKRLCEHDTVTLRLGREVVLDGVEIRVGQSVDIGLDSIGTVGIDRIDIDPERSVPVGAPRGCEEITDRGEGQDVQQH